MTTKPPTSPDATVAANASNGRAARRWILAIGLVVTLAGVLGAVMMTAPNHRPKMTVSIEGGEQNREDERSDGSTREHPLAPALEFARKVEANLKANVRDYTATVLKQERIGLALQPLEVAKVKIREKPFSAYMKFVAPPSLAGQQALFVENENDGKLVARAGSGLRALAGTVQIPPNGPIAMLGQRYPITELGIRNLTRRLIEVGEHDMQYGECYIWMDKDTRVGDRSCTSITVMHPEKHSAFIFHIARIFVDNELMAPLHYEAYDWPTEPGGPPVLLERYTYADLKLNPGLTDEDFDPRNPNYGLLP